nr:MAG TPA: hypothetical protein [Bacteriophage sp.]
MPLLLYNLYKIYNIYNLYKLYKQNKPIKSISKEIHTKANTSPVWGKYKATRHN